MDRDEVKVYKLAKKRTRPISSHLDRTNLVNKGFIIWLLVNFCLRDTAGSPERARSLHLARSGSQSQCAIWFILPAHGASHIIIIVIELPVKFLSFGCLWISACLIYGNPVVCLFSFFASLNYILLRTPEDRTKLVLNLHSCKMISHKIIALFLSSFRSTTFIFLSLHLIVSSSCKNYLISPLYSCVSLNVIHYRKRMELLLYSFSLKLMFAYQFSHRSSRGKEKI